MRERLGMIGLGLVGTALYERLLEAGFDVIGYDIQPEKTEALRRAGGTAASCAAEAAAGCRRVILSLPTSGDAASVVAEIEACLQPGAIVIDTTTGEPGEVVALASRLAARSVAHLDATVGGSSRQVRAGEAIVVCGGDAASYSECADLFSLCFRRAFHVGPSGSGAQMKLVMNLVLGLNRAVLAEGLSYARACGVDAAAALEILKSGPAYSRAMDVKGERMLRGNFDDPDARLLQHLKDVRLILATGARHGARLPFTCLHESLLRRLEAAGHGAADNSAIIKAFEKD